MNCFAAYAVPVPRGYHAMCRFAQNARPWPILEDGKPKVFPIKAEALIAAQAHVIEHINGTMRRDGETLSSARSDAEKLFRGGGKVIPIERKAKKVRSVEEYERDLHNSLTLTGWGE
jgi:hypothetical protein